MYRTILVPVDGSVFAEEALPWAAAIASRSGAAVELAMVHEPPSAAVSVDPPREMLDEVDRVAREYAERYLAEARQRLGAELRGLPTRLLEGQPAEAIARHARPGAVDLVVMTTHGRGPVSRFWLGSVADRLVRRIGVPLLLVRPGRTASPPADGDRRTILVPLDGSDFSESALPNAAALARVMEADLQLLHVVAAPVPPAPPLPYPAQWDPQEMKRRAERALAYLERLAQRLRADGLTVEVTVVPGLDVPGAILGEAEDVMAIAIATHGERGVRRLMLGSVTDKVVRGASVPVLVTPSPAIVGQAQPDEAEAALAH